MKTFLKFILGSLVLFAAVVFLILKFVSLNSFKDKIAEYVKENYDVELVFQKDITHSLFKPGIIGLNDVRISVNNKNILSFEKLLINLEVTSLTENNIIIESITLKEASVDLAQDDIDNIKKKFPSAKKSKTDKKLKFLIKKLKVEQSDIIYQDYDLKNLNMRSKITDKVIDIQKIKFDIYGGTIDSKALIKYSQAPIDLKSSGDFKNINLISWNHHLKDKNLYLKGRVDLNYNIQWNQSQPKSPVGHITAQSKEVLITGMNLNKLLQGFIDSREVGILDIASYAALGPIGAIVTNTLETGKSYPGLGRGESYINQLFVDVELKDGLIKTKDVAFKTEKYRLAAFGDLNLKSSQYEDFAIHVLNKKGCTRIFQKLSGPLDSPDVGATKTFAKGVISPLTNLFDKVVNITGCKPAYEGQVSHP